MPHTASRRTERRKAWAMTLTEPVDIAGDDGAMRDEGPGTLTWAFT